MPGLKERQLPARGVGGERLLAVAVSDLEGATLAIRVSQQDQNPINTRHFRAFSPRVGAPRSAGSCNAGASAAGLSPLQSPTWSRRTP